MNRNNKLHNSVLSELLPYDAMVRQREVIKKTEKRKI